MEKIKLAIVGATGLVGQTFLHILEEQNNSNFEIQLFASKKSKGKKLKINHKYYIVHELDENSFDNVTHACFFTNEDVAKKYIPIALKKNVKVIDNSSAFRNESDIPLIAYYANDYLLNKENTLISNPNCCVIQSIVPIYALRKYNIKKIIVNTYQSVSGSGKKGIDDLIRCRKGLMPIFYQSDISFTCIPLIGKENINHISTEEEKIMNEYKKILNNSNIEIYATCVRVPVMFSHGVSCQIEFSNDFDINDIINDLENIPNVVYCDNIVPTSILSCKNDKIYIGRLRKQNNNLLFYCVADNVRVGAANNSYLLLTKLIELEEENERKSKEN